MSKFLPTVVLGVSPKIHGEGAKVKQVSRKTGGNPGPPLPPRGPPEVSVVTRLK